MIKLNDWPLRNLLLLSLGLLLASTGLIALACAGLDIPVVRQVIALVFLTVIPGALIMRILKIHGIGTTESLACAVGLSIAFTMVGGTLIDLLLPLAGVSRPLSPLPLTAGMCLLVLILMLVAWMRDRDLAAGPEEPPAGPFPLIPVLTLLLLFALTVLGAAVAETFQNNILLIIVLAGIAALVLLAAFDRFIHPGLYPLTIFVIGLCLLYQTTLVSPHPIGSDIFSEYRFYRAAVDAGFWDPSIFDMVNSCLSITILAPVYSLFLGLDGNWLFKAVYPLVFALVPLCLYSAFNRQIGAKKAFLSVFFFVSVPTFSLEMISLCRQQIAELFLALIILLLVDRKLKPYQRLFLLCVFAVSIVVSHYALGLISFVFIAFVLLVMLVLGIRSYRRRSAPDQPDDAGTVSPQDGAIRLKDLIILMSVFLVAGAAWYSLTGSGLIAGSFRNIWDEQIQSVSQQIWGAAPGTGPQAAPLAQDAVQFNSRDGLIGTALGLDFAAATPAGKVFRIIQYITELLLIIGFVKTLLRPRKSGFKPEFLALSLASACLLLASLILPRFADYLNITRLYHIALMTLAPFCILGGQAVWQWAGSAWRKFKKGAHSGGTTGLGFVTLIVLVPYFAFTSGIIYEVTGHKVTDRADLPYSIALSSYRLDLAGVLSPKDGAAAQWAGLNSDNMTVAYADRHAANLLRFYQFPGPVQEFSRDANNPQRGSFLYLDSVNISRSEITLAVATGLRRFMALADVPGVMDYMQRSNRIYSNGGAQLLLLSGP